MLYRAWIGNTLESLYYDEGDPLPLKKNKQDSKWFTLLSKDYTMRYVLHHGIGLFPVNINTGEVCDCKMEWDADGEILSCPVCGLDGT